MEMTEEQQARLVEIYESIVKPFTEWMNEVFPTIVRVVRTISRDLQRLGYLPRVRRPKHRSRLRSRVALKRKGLWATSVWA